MYQEIDDIDRELIRTAAAAIRKVYHDRWHTVGAAVRCSSGKTYVGVNMEFCGYGPCAEPIALGRAITDGETHFDRIVAVVGRGKPPTILPPCGNCRQALVDYAPDCWVILERFGAIVKARAEDLLPNPYSAYC